MTVLLEEISVGSPTLNCACNCGRDKSRFIKIVGKLRPYIAVPTDVGFLGLMPISTFGSKKMPTCECGYQILVTKICNESRIS